MPKKSTERWFVSGAGLARVGPFASQREAYESIKLTDAARYAQLRQYRVDMPYPHDVIVWPEYS